jgi:hypothetical protein
MPSLSITSYRFSFESLETPPRSPVVEDSETASLELELSAGFWNLTVTAFTGSGAGAKEIARGSARVPVVGGEPNYVTIQLGNEPGDDEQGSLGYTVTFPDTVSKASLTLASLGGGEDPLPVNLLEGSTTDGGVITKTGVLDAAAGNYLLSIDLYGSGGNAGKTEAVHIYRNTETVAGTIAFNAGDFSPTTIYQTGSGTSLRDALTAIGTDTNNTDFTVVLGQNETTFAPFTLDTASFGGKRICIRGGGRAITLSGTGSLFTLESGAALVLHDLELRGRGSGVNNNSALVKVEGGDLLINPGTVITGNSSSSSYYYSYGGGVYVSGGTFTMNGGSISGNSFFSTPSYNYGGGGVYVSGGAFTMSGGTITENSSPSSYYHSYGGGVYVGGGTFTMSGGTITGNSSSSSSYSSDGGGVYVGSTATFTMSGGAISGNSSSSSYSYGGGVMVAGTFTMSGGAVTGNSSSSSSRISPRPGGGGVFVSGTFTMSGGSVWGNASSSGGGVYVGSGTFTISNNVRVDPSNEVCLYYSRSGSYGGITLAGNFSGGDTIAVIDLYVDDYVYNYNWLGKTILQKGAGYTGTIPTGRFRLGNFVSSDSAGVISKTPVTYAIDSDGKLVSR